jgi:hypothetical protein
MSTTITSTGITTPTISTTDGFDSSKSDYYIGKVVVEYDSANRSNSNSGAWVTWPSSGAFTNHTGFTGGSVLHIEYWIPFRNDNSSWGGSYTDCQITFDNGVAWRSLGNPGYDGGIMTDGGDTIHGQNQTYLVTGTPASDYSVQLRWRFRPFTNGASAKINQDHAINQGSPAGYCPAGTDGIADTRLGGTDSNQAYGSYRIMELIPTS